MIQAQRILELEREVADQKHTIRALVSLVDALRQNASANMYQLATKKLNQLRTEGLIE